MSHYICQVKNLTVALRCDPSKLILDQVSLNLPQGKIVGVVGGSGSGKTTLGLSMLGLLPESMMVKSGEIWVAERNLFVMTPEEKRCLRGRVVSMSFQESASAFDPVFTVGEQMMAAIRVHQPLSRELLRRKMIEYLLHVEIPDPHRVAASYPHMLSGGLRQRAMLALALSTSPSLLIADEPTSSLDVTTQAVIIELLRKLRRELNLSILLIAHDLGMVKVLADEMVILMRSRVVGNDHPYAKELWAQEKVV